MKYEVYKNFGLWIIHELNNNYKYGLYVKGVKRNGEYIFTQDYTHAKGYKNRATAEKHAEILQHKFEDQNQIL